MSTTVFSIIVYVSVFSVLIPIISYFFNKGFRAPKQNRMIFAVLVASVVADGLSYLLVRQKISNELVNNIYQLITFSIFNLYFNEILFRKRITYVMMLGIFLYITTVIYVCLTSGMFAINDYFWAVGSGILGVHAILYFINIPKMPLERLVDKNLYSNLIINSALAFYFFTTLFIFAFSNYVFTQTTPDTSRLFWSFHNVANILKNIGLAIGFYFTGKRSVYITLEQLEVLSRKQEN